MYSQQVSEIQLLCIVLYSNIEPYFVKRQPHVNNTTQDTKQNDRKKYTQKVKNNIVQHSVNINYNTCRGRQYLQFYFWRSAFISRFELDANTLHNRFSDAE